ncbi:splicing factor 3B subunit 2-like [Chiloscyllium plagiosum]|uniref:splicing factor 3B subunit 2-like n=1 Tax=Chiloscyllium plagiosum TaxID=36176 RepID=UPI001CB7FEBB|nr:splicing factor 3B subunit 2-like [Chiloscyllium plagiosum]
MQRYGPPPSYPNLKIPGLNSPIPESCSFGYHAGGWGKPPVDETGKPLYGDVFGTNSLEFQAKTEEEELDRTPWGELEPSDEESSEEEEEEDESDEDKPDDTGFITPADSGDTPQLYIPVPEKRAATIGGAMMGSTHIYDMSAQKKRKAQPADSSRGTKKYKEFKF